MRKAKKEVRRTAMGYLSKDVHGGAGVLSVAKPPKACNYLTSSKSRYSRKPTKRDPYRWVNAKRALDVHQLSGEFYGK